MKHRGQRTVVPHRLLESYRGFLEEGQEVEGRAGSSRNMYADEVPARAGTDHRQSADSRSPLGTFPGDRDVLVGPFAFLVAYYLTFVPIDLDVPIRLRVLYLYDILLVAVLRHSIAHSRLAEAD